MNHPLRDSLQATFEWQSQLPWLLLLLLALPLVVSVGKFKIYPSLWWTVLLAISVTACVITLFVPSFLVVTAAIDGVLILLAGADWLWLLTRSDTGIRVERSISQTISLGVPVESELTIENRSGMTLIGEVKDDLPEYFSATPSQHTLQLSPGSRMTAKRKLTPGRRGSFELGHVYMKFSSLCHLWVRHKRLPLHHRLKVYPDMKQLADYALLARTNRLSLIGVRKTRRVGQDSEFERLRDYSRDDNYRHIDWKSTARRNKLTVRQFQSDQSQRVIFLLDCGRMMTNSRNGYSLLDHALNSMLMMAYVALHQGDSVGLLCFSDTIHSYIPPRGGSSQMNRLLQASFDQFPRMVESRYDQAFLYLSTHCKQRSLVVLATNVIGRSQRGFRGRLSGQSGRPAFTAGRFASGSPNVRCCRFTDCR